MKQILIRAVLLPLILLMGGCDFESLTEILDKEERESPVVLENQFLPPANPAGLEARYLPPTIGAR